MQTESVRKSSFVAQFIIDNETESSLVSEARIVSIYKSCREMKEGGFSPNMAMGKTMPIPVYLSIYGNNSKPEKRGIEPAASLLFNKPPTWYKSIALTLCLGCSAAHNLLLLLMPWRRVRGPGSPVHLLHVQRLAPGPLPMSRAQWAYHRPP